MPYTPQFIALSTILTILIILISIGVLLYKEKHYRYDIEDMATPIIVSHPEIIAVPVKRISPANVK